MGDNRTCRILFEREFQGSCRIPCGEGSRVPGLRRPCSCGILTKKWGKPSPPTCMAGRRFMRVDPRGTSCRLRQVARWTQVTRLEGGER